MAEVLFRSSVFFFNDTAPTEIYSLSLHDALPIYSAPPLPPLPQSFPPTLCAGALEKAHSFVPSPELLHTRSEEHTSELQSRQYLVCRLLLEKKQNRHEPPTDIRRFNSRTQLPSIP